MNIIDILIWESSNLFLLMPAVIGLLMFRRWMRGWPVFTDRDWIFLIGYPREKILSLHLWLKLGMLWFTVVLIGLAHHQAYQRLACFHPVLNGRRYPRSPELRNAPSVL
jgi:hypothetical protein